MSDLIERYGYERAVRELKAMDDRAIWMISSCLKYREEVRKECLEHRRQHNIFEVGDKVVIKAHPFWPEDYMIHNVEQEHIGKWYMRYWKHATDLEIKAGRRL